MNAATRQHTPGPCERHAHAYADTIQSVGGSCVCSLIDGIDKTANARLIAAAPELIAALADCLAFWEAPPTGFDCPTSRRKKLEAIQRNARAAIAKATGNI